MLMNDAHNFLVMKFGITAAMLVLSFYRNRFLHYFLIYLSILSGLTILLLGLPAIDKVIFGTFAMMTFASVAYFTRLRNTLIRKVNRDRKSIEKFARMNAHEIRGPLARILGLAYVAKLEIPENEFKKILRFITSFWDASIFLY